MSGFLDGLRDFGMRCDELTGRVETMPGIVSAAGL